MLIAGLLSGLSVPLSARPFGQGDVTVTADSAGPSYARLARLTLDADVVLDATIRSAARIRPAEAVGLAPGHARFYVVADVGALVRAKGPLPARIGYLVDVPFDARGRLPNLKKQRVIAFARGVAGRSDQVQLTTPNAQFAFSPTLDTRVRDLVREVLDPAAPPAITGLGNAFHVPGTLPGEGETQIFLQTQGGDPVSMLVLRRPGEQRRWALALGDIIDEAGGPPKPDTLAWYRLACGLPENLPDSSLQSQEPANAAIARDDYRFVREALGRCDDGVVR
jgi:hypothetical protein